MNEITVGSAAFFSGMEGFAPMSVDKLSFVDATRNGWWRYAGQQPKGVLHYKWVKKSVAELVEKLSHCTDSKRVLTLLVPEFAKAVKGKLTYSQYLTAIKPAIDRLSGKHGWGVKVYDAYVTNGAMTMTDEQRQAAYEAYAALRKDEKRH